MMITSLRNGVREPRQSLTKMGLLAGSSVMAAGCVQLAAPEKPIEINLNINIRQEVLVKLQKDVQELIDKNPGVF